MAIFNSFLLVYQRVPSSHSHHSYGQSNKFFIIGKSWVTKLAPLSTALYRSGKVLNYQKFQDGNLH